MAGGWIGCAAILVSPGGDVAESTPRRPGLGSRWGGTATIVQGGGLRAVERPLLARRRLRLRRLIRSAGAVREGTRLWEGDWAAQWLGGPLSGWLAGGWVAFRMEYGSGQVIREGRTRPDWADADGGHGRGGRRHAVAGLARRSGAG